MRTRLRLEKMVHGGRALARLEGGRVALISDGLPGEVVEAELQEKSGVLQGRVTEVVTPHESRVPASPHPGLDYSFMRYDAQLTLKREVVLDSLQRSLKRELVVPDVVPAPEVWHYRHAVQPAVTQDGLGYRQEGSHDVVTLTDDPVAHESINRVWQLWQESTPVKGVRELVFRANDRGQVLLSLIASGSAKHYLARAHELVRHGVTGVSYAHYDPRGRFRSGFERLAGERSILQPYGRFPISVTASSFAQPNPKAASLLYEQLGSWAGEGDAALDLYAGSGIIGMHLAQTYRQVTALEIDRSAVVRGERDAKRLGIANLEFQKADAKRLDTLPDAELITVDPPRAGLSKALREALVRSSANRLLYVSCDVATWARDVTELEGAGFTLSRLQPYDFYPQTHHIEMLSLLEREAASMKGAR